MSRRIELWISIQELNEQGEYSSVELHPGKDISTGGVFQLRQVREKNIISIQHTSSQTGYRRSKLIFANLKGLVCLLL